jgi:phage terminase Nu1 subunit (DNA packaging protein)
MAGHVVSLDDERMVRRGREPWCTKQELADHLGFSVRWVELRVREGLPARRMGQRLRFQISAVEAWLAERHPGSAA